ncbi:MAG: hypothetical protein KF764_02915 [Labilithrix sp.]|nr:hypothetical protein [Labilithrix sp.]
MGSKAKGPFTRRDLAEMRDAIEFASLYYRPIRGDFDTRPDTYPERFQAFLEANRKRVVLWGIENRRLMFEGRATEQRKTAEHFRAHPGIYGDATPEMIARFEGLASESTKEADFYAGLVARVEAHGIPHPL